ncbi:MAG: 1,4-alpha-glucan branching protein GlgB [Clostridia bacterium]|nr:1,4-alpha-glucan branching protein GlgB [Clostridia bacterium]
MPQGPERKRIWFSSYDSFLFHEGTNYQSYRKFGAHIAVRGGVKGVELCVWAPNAREVSVMHGGNGWTPGCDKMECSGGVWTIFLPGMKKGDSYRFAVLGADGVMRHKSDPYAFYSELRPSNASVVWPLKGYKWRDGEWMASRDSSTLWKKPVAIYEVHLGSWKKDYRKNKDGFLNYRELAHQLAEYVTFMGYTHVELMGICEYPFDGSWGYQVTGYFSPTARHGTPDDFRYFVDVLHQNGIGVIIDWVPAHFPKDPFGLEHFDGSALYESADPLLAEYPEWGTMAFDHGKPEVRSFLISGAMYWINEFHADALRVDAVAAMLFTNFSRDPWRPNKFGGSENLESRAFLRQLNSAVKHNSTACVMAEDSSIEAGMTTDPEYGGYGFTFKWNMGWMNEMLKYIEKDPIYRKYHHDLLTHPPEYAFNENYVLVISHDEVVHLKKSMLLKNPGSMPDKFGALKTFYTYMFTLPGKKLLFMGQDFAGEGEWTEDRQIEWFRASDMWHRDVMECVRSLLSVYKKYECLYTDGRDARVFQWINRGDAPRNTVSFIRRNPFSYRGALAVVCNFSPVGYGNYSFGVPFAGQYERVFSTYDTLPGGGGPAENGAIPPVEATTGECDGYPYRLTYGLRPYESVIFELPCENE